MDTKDILLYESGDGGEMSIIADDLVLGETLYQQVYLALFGGNVEANTRSDILPTEERFEWWGNALFFKETPSKQFNSNTERILPNVVLNSAGRQKIALAVSDDLVYLSDVLDSKVEVQFPSTNKIRIIVKFSRKGKQEDQVLQLVYDNSKNELIIEKVI
jgi:phage gp46-like protein